MNSTITATTVRSEYRAFQLAALLGTLLLIAPWATAEKKPPPQAIIAGTVFQDNGGSLPGARVVVVSESDPGDKREAFTDRRGEFAIRVPGGTHYRVTASAKGFEAQEKTVEAFEGERVTKNFLLSAAKDFR